MVLKRLSEHSEPTAPSSRPKKPVNLIIPVHQEVDVMFIRNLRNTALIPGVFQTLKYSHVRYNDVYFTPPYIHLRQVSTSSLSVDAA